MSVTNFAIAGRMIGTGAPPYVVAEIGINHGGDTGLAIKLLEAAKQAGVDAAKLQAFVPERFLARSSPYFDLLADCALPAPAIRDLMQAARDIGITLFSTVFDEESADHLAASGAPAFKIASGDVNHIPLLRHTARFGRPMLISTGGSTIGEIEAALEAVRSISSTLPLALFHCVSNYPTAAGDANLACLGAMKARFGVPVGFSDHTLGTAVAVAAVALGAELLEKHFTLDRSAPGPDHALSADPASMAELVAGAKAAHAAIGRSVKAPVEPKDFIPQMRRSVTAFVDIPKGRRVTADMLAVKRPGTGIAPAEFERVVGRIAARDIAADTTLTWGDLA